jgi:hypothetical protein
MVRILGLSTESSYTDTGYQEAVGGQRIALQSRHAKISFDCPPKVYLER